MKLSSAQRNSLESAVKAAEANLILAASYLRDRGITEEAARASRLGVVDRTVQYTAEFAGRLMIPYRTRSGVVSAKFRCMEDHSCKEVKHPKYMGLDGVDSILYNTTDLFTDSYTIAVCEGELDALVLSNMVGIPAVGCPGVNGWKPWHPRLFNQQFERVLLFVDADEAGREFGKRLIRGDPKHKMAPLEGAQVVVLPDGMDVNDVYLKEGPSGLRKRAGLED